jgi:uncharacterized protein YndB with AHSA1/START domain
VNGRLETADNRPVLIFERRFAHAVERVWRAITEPDELRHWSPGIPDWKPEPGEAFQVEGSGGGCGKIVELEPPHLLAYDWGDQHFRFELRADGDGCVLHFTHVFDDHTLGAQHAAGWDACFDRLDALLGGGRPLSEAASLERWPELHERYAEHFGLDPEVGRQTFATHMSPER